MAAADVVDRVAVKARVAAADVAVRAAADVAVKVAAADVDRQLVADAQS